MKQQWQGETRSTTSGHLGSDYSREEGAGRGRMGRIDDLAREARPRPSRDGRGLHAKLLGTLERERNISFKTKCTCIANNLKGNIS